MQHKCTGDNTQTHKPPALTMFQIVLVTYHTIAGIHFSNHTVGLFVAVFIGVSQAKHLSTNSGENV